MQLINEPWNGKRTVIDVAYASSKALGQPVYPPSLGSITKTCLFKYTEVFTTKNEKIQVKSSDIFLISVQKHRLWVLVRTASTSRNKKNNVYPCKPQFYYIKVEFTGSKLFRHVFVMRTFAARSCRR